MFVLFLGTDPENVKWVAKKHYLRAIGGGGIGFLFLPLIFQVYCLAYFDSPKYYKVKLTPLMDPCHCPINV